MSDKLPQESQNEEVDLGQLFNAIGQLFEKLFAFIAGLFKGLFSGIIYALKPIVNHIKLIAIILMVTTILGYIAEKFNEPVYVSDMLVKPYFSSKYQLANNVDYFNALIGSQSYKELGQIFEIDTATVAKELLGFEIAIGPETQNDLLKEYNDYIKTIDSTLASEVTYEQFIENRDILAGNIFSITAIASRNNIFPSLEKGFIKTFENDYSKKLKRIRDSTILIQQGYFKRQLKRNDSLQRVYLSILESESREGKLPVTSNGLFPLTQERTKTREFELFQEELEIRNNLRKLDEKLIEESQFFDILSGFEEVGSPKSSLWQKYSLLFPALATLMMILIYVMFNTFKFIKNYE